MLKSNFNNIRNMCTDKLLHYGIMKTRIYYLLITF